MPATETMLSVAQVCELQPGDAENASWINPGFTAVVRKIDQKTTKAGKKFWPCVLADTTGSATIEVSFFTAPKFSEGDQIEISGQGLRRTEYMGKPQAAIGQKTEIHVIGKSVHHEEQKARAETGQPAINGELQHIPGQTVGMAMKEAIALCTRGLADTGECLNSQTFWASVHAAASDIIRVSQLLEKGKLAKPVRERNGAAPRTPAPESAAPANGTPTNPPKRTAPANDREAANLADDLGEDVPF